MWGKDAWMVVLLTTCKQSRSESGNEVLALQNEGEGLPQVQ